MRTLLSLDCPDTRTSGSHAGAACRTMAAKIRRAEMNVHAFALHYRDNDWEMAN